MLTQPLPFAGNALLKSRLDLTDRQLLLGTGGKCARQQGLRRSAQAVIDHLVPRENPPATGRSARDNALAIADRCLAFGTR
jgi:hypothetical protein